MSETTRIPIIDFSPCSLDKETCSNSEALANDIVQAFSTVGFVYLRNHGISDAQIDETFRVGDEFFNLPETTKAKYKRGKLSQNHGWLKIGGEKFDGRPADYKECYDVNPPQAKHWPESEVPSFEKKTVEFYASCRKLAHRILELMAIGLKLEDPAYFTSRHNQEKFTLTALRYLHYPPLPLEKDPAVADMPADQLRCGEHTDYGALTLLFQDQAGGLEIYDRELGYVAAPPIPGTVVINLGDLMQRWTADRLVSTKHRVMPVRRGGRRRSVVCFVHPDADCLITPIDGSAKYPPITARDYIRQRFADTLQSGSSTEEEEED